MKSAGNIYGLHKKLKAWSKETAGEREIPLPPCQVEDSIRQYSSS